MNDDKIKDNDDDDIDDDNIEDDNDDDDIDDDDIEDNNDDDYDGLGDKNTNWKYLQQCTMQLHLTIKEIKRFQIQNLVTLLILIQKCSNLFQIMQIHQTLFQIFFHQISQIFWDLFAKKHERLVR